MLSPLQIKNTLTQCIEQMNLQRERFVRNPQKDFVRNTKCNLATTTKIILSFESNSLKSELYNFFSADLDKLIRKSTFVQQREKFSDDAFENLFNDFNKAVPFNKRFHKLNIVAVDGSDVNLPTLKTDEVNFVEGCKKNGNGFYQFHCNALYNICEDRFMDLEIQPRNQFNEGKAFISMLERFDFTTKTVFIGDRNYFSWNTIAHVSEENQYYLFRLKDLYCKHSSFKDMVPATKAEFDIFKKLKLIRSTKKIYTSNPEYKPIHNKHVFDYIDVDDHTKVYPIEFRLVSIEISKDNFEYLLTNLPSEEFPASTLKKLYKMRWNEEISFKLLKYSCGLNWFHSVKRKNIIQEIYARLIMYNFTSLLISATPINTDKKYKHDIKQSFSNAAKVARMYLTHKYSNILIKTLILSEIIPIRDDRHAPRNVRSQRVNPLNTRV